MMTISIRTARAESWFLPRSVEVMRFSFLEKLLIVGIGKFIVHYIRVNKGSGPLSNLMNNVESFVSSITHVRDTNLHDTICIRPPLACDATALCFVWDNFYI
jgi:hypothetical protein